MRLSQFIMICYTASVSVLHSGCSHSCDDHAHGAHDEPARINGTVLNPTGETVTLTQGDKKFSADLVDGAFELTADIKEAGKVRLKMGQEYATMYLRPGDDLDLHIDLNEFDESIQFMGVGAERNNYLAAKLLDDEANNADKHPANFSEYEFIDYVNAEKKRHQGLLSQFQAGNECAAKDFVACEQMEIDYSWASSMLNYQEYHRYFSGESDFTVSKGFYDFVDGLDMNPKGAAKSDAYMAFAENFADWKAYQTSEEGADQTAITSAKLDAIDGNLKSLAVKNELYASILTNHIYYYGADGVAPLYERFKGVCDDAECVARVEEVYEQWSKLVKGLEAPTWRYEDLTGKLVSLEDMKGKVVYVDVWATWCGPCRRELPYLEEMQAELVGRDDIIFTSISIDEDKEAWKEMVVDEEMQGVQLHAAEAWESNIVKDYAIRGIPRFIVVDKEGNIGSANAPRPSSGEVEEMLLELAGE